MSSSPTRSLAAAVLAAAALVVPGAGFAQSTDIAGGAIRSILILRSQDAESTSSTSFSTTAAQATIKATKDTLLTVRFSAQSTCSRIGSPEGYCGLRIVATPEGGGPGNEIELRPGTIAFDSPDAPDGTGYVSANSVDRSVVLQKAGKYRVEVRYFVSAPDMTFELASWSMTIEKADSR